MRALRLTKTEQRIIAEVTGEQKAAPKPTWDRIGFAVLICLFVLLFQAMFHPTLSRLVGELFEPRGAFIREVNRLGETYRWHGMFLVLVVACGVQWVMLRQRNLLIMRLVYRDRDLQRELDRIQASRFQESDA